MQLGIAQAQMIVTALAAVAVRTATLTGTGVDIKEYEGVMKVALHGLRTTGDLAGKLQDSADNSTGWADLSTDKFAGFTAIAAGTDFLQVVDLKVDGCKRYVRFVGTATNTPSHTYGATISGAKKST
jgi:hypothetical protein